jgi:phosphatidylglycerophosphate synthase
MGADTAFTIIVTLCLVRLDLVGPWVILIGLMRPAFVAAARLWPRLALPLPPSRGRKVACGLALGLLVAGLAPLLAPMAPLLAFLALGVLAWSFGRDLRRLLARGAAA